MAGDPIQPERCSTYLRAVAEPDRLRIVQFLRGGARSVGAIAAHLGVPLANASHHLQLLRRAGLVTGVKRGRLVEYALASTIARGRSLGVLDFGCCRIELPGRG